MRKWMIQCCLLLQCLYAVASRPGEKVYTTANAHSHNDYEQEVPFYTAYQQGFGSIEADVFVKNGVLYVAHEQQYIKQGNTLEALYLQPLQRMIQNHDGKVYANSDQSLTLLIDLKTAAEPTLDALIRVLNKYPQLRDHPHLKWIVSGNQPPLNKWSQYPGFIEFDGKKGWKYDLQQSGKISLVSCDIKRFTNWNGKGIIIQEEREPLQAWIDSVHQAGKEVRFYGAPDNVNTWQTLMNMGVDLIGTDKPVQLGAYLKNRDAAIYKVENNTHPVYPARFVNNDSLSGIKNVILLIGDGMGLAQVYAGLTANKGKLNLLQMINIGFSKTYSEDSYITDSAAGGTAMATGHKTNNRHISVDATGVNKLIPIPGIIASKNIKSALISVGDITDATPAAFYAHCKDRSEQDKIAKDFLQSPVNILIGSGIKHFNRKVDGKTLLEHLQQNGYEVATDADHLASFSSDKFVLIDEAVGKSIQKGRGDILRKALVKSMESLSANKDGFFIMAEAAQIDYGGHANNMAYVTTEMLDFDKAIGAAMEFADKDGHTLVIVTADHETGGLSLLDGSIDKGELDGNFSTNDHTAIMVPVFAYGPGSLLFRGVYENTAIFDKILQAFQASK